VKRRFNFFYFAPIIFVSAVTGKNVFDLIDRAEKIQQKLKQKIKISYLNTLVQDLLSEKKFLTEANRVFNPKYISIGSYRPFFIDFHTSSGHKLKPAHETYLKKRLVEKLELEGIPVFFKITAKKK
jgi:GTP-binding protein